MRSEAIAAAAADAAYMACDASSDQQAMELGESLVRERLVSTALQERLDALGEHMATQVRAEAPNAVAVAMPHERHLVAVVRPARSVRSSSRELHTCGVPRVSISPLQIATERRACRALVQQRTANIDAAYREQVETSQKRCRVLNAQVRQQQAEMLALKALNAQLLNEV